MQILEKPVQAVDWTTEVRCERCQAILAVVSDDVELQESRHPDYYSKIDVFGVRCEFCSDFVRLSNLPWSVKNLAESKKQTHLISNVINKMICLVSRFFNVVHSSKSSLFLCLLLAVVCLAWWEQALLSYILTCLGMMWLFIF